MISGTIIIKKDSPVFSRAWAAQEASKLSAAKSRFAGAFQPVEDPASGEDVVFYFEG